jgi:hypothetical protein
LAGKFKPLVPVRHARRAAHGLTWSGIYSDVPPPDWYELVEVEETLSPEMQGRGRGADSRGGGRFLNVLPPSLLWGDRGRDDAEGQDRRAFFSLKMTNSWVMRSLSGSITKGIRWTGAATGSGSGNPAKAAE